MVWSKKKAGKDFPAFFDSLLVLNASCKQITVAHRTYP